MSDTESEWEHNGSTSGTYTTNSESEWNEVGELDWNERDNRVRGTIDDDQLIVIGDSTSPQNIENARLFEFDRDEPNSFKGL